MHGTSQDPWAGLRANLLLRALNAGDARLLSPLLARTSLAADAMMVVEGRSLTHVYFPETAIVRVCARGATGARIPIGLIGREGVVGWTAIVGDEPPTHSCTVLMAGGAAMAIPIDKLRQAAALSPSLTASLLRYIQTFTVQMERTIVSGHADPARRRLARWLLMLHDRSDGNELTITHDELAELLNVRRASVTDALHLLEGEGLLRCTRGLAVIRDRARLESEAGDSYGLAEARYRALIGPFGPGAIGSFSAAAVG